MFPICFLLLYMLQMCVTYYKTRIPGTFGKRIWNKILPFKLQNRHFYSSSKFAPFHFHFAILAYINLLIYIYLLFIACIIWISSELNYSAQHYSLHYSHILFFVYHTKNEEISEIIKFNKTSHIHFISVKPRVTTTLHTCNIYFQSR